MPAKSKATSHKCSNKSCQNRYDGVIGGARMKGTICIPCLCAEQIVDQGLTIEQAEGVPELKAMFADLLGKTGWTWSHVADSYRRMQGASNA